MMNGDYMVIPRPLDPMGRPTARANFAILKPLSRRFAEGLSARVRVVNAEYLLREGWEFYTASQAQGEADLVMERLSNG